MIRYEFQAELFGLNPPQQQTAIQTVQAQVDANRITIIGTLYNEVRDSHGDTEYFAQFSFTTRASADSMFDTVLSWAGTHANDATSGRHSYAWLKQVDDVQKTITKRYAESPGWVEQDSTDVL